ncbi:MAG: winged helix-turn-helix transcriptional regulator [Deltaproteobacteria bacterium]|nr:winged helix-turn-helix transcriptional regulator [Candidatus Zymogenaceae bacterium]
MDKEDLRILRIMEEVENKDNITQRELAGKLGISIGMTNIFIKRIIKKGYMKITTIPPRRLAYIITPKGFMEKSRLTMEYLKYSLDFYRSIKTQIEERLVEIESAGSETLVFYGTGDICELACLFLGETGMTLTAIADDTGTGSVFHMSIIPPEKLPSVHWDALLITSLEDVDVKRQRLSELGIEHEKIYTLQ